MKWDQVNEWQCQCEHFEDLTSRGFSFDAFHGMMQQDRMWYDVRVNWDLLSFLVWSTVSTVLGLTETPFTFEHFRLFTRTVLHSTSLRSDLNWWVICTCKHPSMAVDLFMCRVHALLRTCDSKQPWYSTEIKVQSCTNVRGCSPRRWSVSQSSYMLQQWCISWRVDGS